jgi:hypothetical protein
MGIILPILCNRVDFLYMIKRSFNVIKNIKIVRFKKFYSVASQIITVKPTVFSVLAKP